MAPSPRAVSFFDEDDSAACQTQTLGGALGLALYRRVVVDFDQPRAVARGAATGFCLRGGLHLAALLFSVVSKRRRGGPRSGQQRLADRLLETGRYTAFLAAFAGIYVGVDEGLAAALGKREPKARHHSLALYILLRGITLLVRCGTRPGAPPALRKALALTQWEHGDTALMCLCTAQIGYSWILQPSTLPPAFVRFLNHHGGKEMWYYEACREYSRRSRHGPVSTRLAALAGTEYEDLVASHPCDWAHPGTGCNWNALTFFPGAYLRALPVYLPVYILPALLVHRESLVKGPGAGPLWAKVLRGAARSAAFLALYCTLAWRGACVGFQATGTAAPAVIAGFCWTGGLATLAEKKSRRMELAIYCLSRAAESFALCLVQWGWVRARDAPRRLDVLLFSAATAAIMHCYSDSDGRHRSVFRSKYLNVLDFVFGSSGHEANSIRHIPSTRELLEKAAAPVERMGLSRHSLTRGTRSLIGSLEHLAALPYEPLERPQEELTVVDFSESASQPEPADPALESSRQQRARLSEELHRTHTAPGSLQGVPPDRGVG